ncbi:MAG: hypothetical protein ATN32_03375 [Candidatus Epulonipiscium fishelsonii]|nr:MAG: hypothetical protein ATN32_03375 [Epulopiscium sp. AS2M-Bin002]
MKLKNLLSLGIAGLGAIFISVPTFADVVYYEPKDEPKETSIHGVTCDRIPYYAEYDLMKQDLRAQYPNNKKLIKPINYQTIKNLPDNKELFIPSGNKPDIAYYYLAQDLNELENNISKQLTQNIKIKLQAEIKISNTNVDFEDIAELYILREMLYILKEEGEMRIAVDSMKNDLQLR